MKLDALICRGHLAASGLAAEAGNNHLGTLRLQAPVFARHGFEWRNYLEAEPYWGTLNCYIGQQPVDPLTYLSQAVENKDAMDKDRQFDKAATDWDIRLNNITWLPDDTEDFLFLKGHIYAAGVTSPCMIYCPVPISKQEIVHLPTILEIVAPPLPFEQGPIYGQKVVLEFPDGKLALTSAPQRAINPVAKSAQQPRNGIN